jgi:hypothetical protein
MDGGVEEPLAPALGALAVYPALRNAGVAWALAGIQETG